MMRLWSLAPPQELAVVIAAVATYVVLLLLVRVTRARVFARLSAADAVLLLVIGAVVGRGILGSSPTLEGAALGCGALVVVRVAVALLSRSPRGRRLVEPTPLLLIAGGRVLAEHRAIAHVRDDDLRSALRRAGVARVEEVVCAVLESDGTISITRFDERKPLDRRLFLDVRGIEQVPDRFFAPS